MGWLIALLCLLLIGLFPLGICLRYDQQGGRISVIAGPFRVAVYPKRNNGNKHKTAKKAPSKDGFESHAHATKKRGEIKEFLPLVRLVLDFLIDFHSKLRVNNLQFKVIFAEDDPCDLSVRYGQAWAAVGNLMPLLERYFVIKKRDIEIECDYTADTTIVNASVDLTISVRKLLIIGVYHGWRVLRKYLQITKKVKDGATL